MFKQISTLPSLSSIYIVTQNRTISIFSLEKGAGNRIFIITLRCVILSDRRHRYQITKRRTWLNYFVKIDMKPVELVKPLKNNELDSPGFRFVHGFGLGSSKSGSYTQDCDRRIFTRKHRVPCPHSAKVT